MTTSQIVDRAIELMGKRKRYLVSMLGDYGSEVIESKREIARWDKGEIVREILEFEFPHWMADQME